VIGPVVEVAGVAHHVGPLPAQADRPLPSGDWLVRLVPATATGGETREAEGHGARADRVSLSETDRVSSSDTDSGGRKPDENSPIYPRVVLFVARGKVLDIMREIHGIDDYLCVGIFVETCFTHRNHE